MKLRYYLRGLGIGIVVTALIMGIIGKEGLPLTDAEIRAAARELGMVESDALKLTDIQPDPNPGVQGQDESAEGSETQREDGSDGETEPSEGESSVGTESSEGAESGGRTESEDKEESSDGTGSQEEGEPEKETESRKEESSDGSESQDEGESLGGTESADAGEASGEAETSDSSVSEETVTVTIISGSGSGTVCRQLEEAGLIEEAREYDRYLIREGYSKRICAGTYEIPVGADWEEIAKIISRTS